MAMVSVGCVTDEFGRPVYTYIDTDELSDEEYAEYCKILEEKGSFEASKYLCSVA